MRTLAQVEKRGQKRRRVQENRRIVSQLFEIKAPPEDAARHPPNRFQKIYVASARDSRLPKREK